MGGYQRAKVLWPVFKAKNRGRKSGDTVPLTTSIPKIACCAMILHLTPCIDVYWRSSEVAALVIQLPGLSLPAFYRAVQLSH